MRHNTYLFLGELASTAKAVKQYVMRYGSEDAQKYFCALRWQEFAETVKVTAIERQEPDETDFHADDDYLYQVTEQPLAEITGDRRDEQIKSFFRNWYDSHVVLQADSTTDNLLLSLVLPADNLTLAEQVMHLAKLIEGGVGRIDIEVLLLAPDLYKAFCTDEQFLATLDKTLDEHQEQARAVVAGLLRVKRDSACLTHVILMQNRNKDGVALNLTQGSLARIIGSYALVCIESYQRLFTPAVALDSRGQDQVVGIGISGISFDRYYFRHYLLHQAYLRVMERENVTQKDVDVNKAAQRAKEALDGRTTPFSNFFNSCVQPELDKGRTIEEITPKLREQVDIFFNELEESLTAYIDDPDLSLPEKFAVLAQILVMDEDSLAGTLYDKEQPTFIDLYREPIDYFLDQNNQLLTFKADAEGNIETDPDTAIPLIDKAYIRAPQRQDGYVFLPADIIKALRIEIRQASDYIRQKTEQLENIKKNQKDNRHSDEVVVDNEFRKYKFLDDDIKEDPFEEDYIPTPTTVDNIDLSPDFTEVKDQGQVGACSTFAVTSVYEYILKKNDKTDTNLSERFIYYNVREEHGRLGEEGAAITDVVRSVHGKGICTEEKCPYTESEYNERPAPEAYADAEMRKIKTAKNIPLGADIAVNRDTIRSAIAEGYPVVFGTRLFDTFLHHIDSTGIVPMPTKEELESEEHYLHAMVVCGYDDKNELFLVRNSWGTHFGHQGYCYIPYAYLCDPALTHYACVITEVADLSIQVKGVKGRHRVALDITDNRIKMAIISMMIAAKQKEQERLVAMYNSAYAQYETVVQTLEDAALREQITDDMYDRLQQQRNSAQERQRRLTDQKGERLDAFDKITIRQLIKIGGATLGFLLAYGLFAYLRFDWSMLTRLIGMEAFLKVTYFVAVVAVLIFLLTYVYYQSRKKQRRQLEDAIDAQIQQVSRHMGMLQRQCNELKLRSFVAGMVIDHLTTLGNRLYALRNSMNSYVNNLAAWYDEEKENIQTLTPDADVPFLTLLDNDILDSYFQTHADELTSDIHLYECLHGEYEIDEAKILSFKNRLKKRIEQQLDSALEGFSVYRHMAALQKYSFVAATTDEAKATLVKHMGRYSAIFLRKVNPGSTVHNVFIDDATQEVSSKWDELCRRNLNGNAITGSHSSPMSIIDVQVEHLSPDEVSMLEKVDE